MKKTFTLVELLVVIAIIAILAALLLPALTRARMIAQGATCAGNLKQVQMFASNYVDNHEGYFPNAKQPTSWSCPWTLWSNPSTSLTFMQEALGTPSKPYRVLKCSSFTPIPNDNGWYTNYAMNIRITPYNNWSRTSPLKVDRIRQPSYCNTFSEQKQMVNTDGSLVAMQQDGARDWRRYSHGKKMNVSYLDGHVALYDGELPVGTLNTEGNLFWYGNVGGLYL